MQSQCHSPCARLATALTLALLSPLAMAQDVAAANATGCAAQFEVAQRVDMESFRDFDAETWRASHDARAVSVLGGGQVFIGIDAIMNAMRGHFANREAQWSWVEKYRVVDGCKSAYILYETVYAIPRIGYRQRALTGVSYSHKGNHWLSVSDQSTPLPTP